MPLYFDDLKVGMRFETDRRTITEADLLNFSEISGDFNPLHTNEEFARASIFGRRVAHGTFLLAAATGLRQQTGLFAGTMMAFLEIRSWKFPKPVYIGDTIHVVTEIVDLWETSKPERGVMVQRVRVLNQHDEPVCEGEFVNMVRRKAAG